MNQARPVSSLLVYIHSKNAAQTRTLTFRKQSPGHNSSHLPLDTHKFGMPCKWDVRYGIPLQSHLQCRCTLASPGHATWMGRVSCQGGSLLCSALSSSTSSTQHFSHFNLPSGRGRVITGRPLHGHGHPASWNWASSPQTLGSINAQHGGSSQAQGRGSFS